MLGGAGNVARNITALGAHCDFISLVGEDATAETLRTLCANEAGMDAYFTTESHRTTTLKTRYIAGSQQLLRADCEDSSTAQSGSQAEMEMRVKALLQEQNVLVLSDYAKGALPAPLIRTLIAYANAQHIPVFVDPKQWDISLYAGATLISPNEKEMQLLNRTPLASDDAMVAAARAWCTTHDITYVLITRGAKGMMLVNADGIQTEIKADVREVFDVSGAGDTAMATLAVAVAAGATMEEGVHLANVAAGIAVGRTGTAVVQRTDLKNAIHKAHLTTGSEKICSPATAKAMVAAWQAEGLRVGFTNGCFDLVHAGHIASISAAKSYCDRLLIAINSDASVRKLKGESRPVHQEMDRAMLLAALQDVSMVIIFSEDTPEMLLEMLRPDVLMKGADYAKEQIVGWQFVESYGGEVVRIPLVEGYSSTGTMKRIRAGH
jgi:D-beta-D-heptose 7-phosphate kinase / D-beta-D-heptose 1-phosphate adenosyltransferase